MQLSPHKKRAIIRILPFGIIWLLNGWVFILVETAAMGTATPDSPTIINLTPKVFGFASVAVLIVGFLVGFLEIVFIEKLFRRFPFVVKIAGKFVLYLLLMLMVIGITYPIAASLELNSSLLDKRVWQKFSNFMVSITFLSTLLQMGSSIFLSTAYAAVSENMGHSVMFDLLRGKYHRPKEEFRIFMFIDMKASTSYAEKLGHVNYFELLSSYYDCMSNAIIEYCGEVYQYIGDEVVISWNFHKGLENNNCVQCFFTLKNDMKRKSDFFKNKFGIIPEFKAGIHLGRVTTGEIGALKKEIFFTGDVLNVTARLQSLCNTYQKDLIASIDLVKHLNDKGRFGKQSHGFVNLKGRNEPMEIYSIHLITASVNKE